MACAPSVLQNVPRARNATSRAISSSWARFTGYADGMMEEKEFFIRKAIGWVLREAGRATPERVVDYLESRLLQISGLSLREGIKHLGAEDRERLIAAYRAR